MKVAILQAGGKGARIESLAKGLLPKQLLPCNKGAIIDYALEACDLAKCLPHIVLPPNDFKIAEYIGNRQQTVFSISKGTQLEDTLAFKFLYKEWRTIYIMPDTMFKPLKIVDLMMQNLLSGYTPAIVALFETDEPQKFGMCKLAGQSVTEVVDKPEEWSQGSGVAWGLIAWNKPFWEAIDLAVYDSQKTFSDVLNYAIRLLGPIPYVMLHEYVDIATPDDYRKALESSW